MSTVLLTDRQHTTSIHPPDTGDRQILTIPDQIALQRLPLSDRLTLRIGLWLLERGLHTHQATPEASAYRPALAREQALTEHEAITWLSFDLQRGLR